MDDGRNDSSDDIQYLNIKNGYKKSYKDNEKQTNIQNINEEDQVYVSRHALRFAVEDRLPPLKIQCDPMIKSHEDGSIMVKEFLNHIEQNFRKLNPRFNQPFGFDHYMVDNNGYLICFTNYIELFIYMCNISIYPEYLNKTKIHPLLPAKLPARNAIILKFIDNKIKFDDIQIIVKEKLKSVYAIEEMAGTRTYRSRHIRVDLLSKEEYSGLLNSGKFVIGGHLYEVDEYIPAPKILICNKCNTPGHVKKNCKSSTELCKRCGKDRNDGADHKVCCIKCHHCDGDHEATNFKCVFISKFRQELMQQLKNNTHLLPSHIQLYIPQQFRDQRGKKVLMNKNVELYQHQTRRDEMINFDSNDPSIWPALKSNSALTTTANTTSIWNSDLRKIQDEFINLKKEYDSEVKKVKMECDNQFQKMFQCWQIVNLQIKSQADAITDIYSAVTETLPPITQSIQIIINVMKELNRTTADENERQLKEHTFTTINDTIVTINNRLNLLNDHQRKLKDLMDKQNELTTRGRISTDQFANES